MELNGKCKEDFEKWAIENENCKIVLGTFCMKIDSFWIVWIKVDPSMRWGVIQDFADSKKCNNVWVRRVEGQFKSSSHDYFNTRPQARTAAVEKFNEIYNNERTNS